MREIKFRAWDIVGLKMITDYIVVREDGHFISNNENTTEHIPMQYIGVIDKNGKDIYEGDIIRWDDNSKGEYWRVAKVVINPDIQLVIVKNSKHEISTMFPHTFHWGSFIYTGDKQLEIIGNIYENPELLNN